MRSPGTSSTTTYGDRERVSVLLPMPLGPYDYTIPESMLLRPGDLVTVPLGPRDITGVVWDEPPGGVDAAKLKDVRERLDVPPLPDNLRHLIDWVARYTLAHPGNVLRMALSTPEAFKPSAPRIVYGPGGPPPPRMTAARKRVLEVVADGPPRSRREIAEEAAVSPGVVQGLEQAGALATHEVVADAAFAIPDPGAGGPKLSQAQRMAADDLVSKVAARRFSATLLEGVPGAGKTEVYFEAVAEALRQGRESLVMVPEITLTSQWLERFERRFGVRPAEWHSDLPRRERRRVWRAVAEGRAPVVVGARSALFLPFANPGLIVVDEEHDSSFKQEEGVIYNARDMAVVRAREAGAPVVLVSATPSLETVVNAESGRFGQVLLPERHGGAALPDVELLDMRDDPPAANHWLSPVLEREILQTLAAGKQSLLFLNRRGYAPLTLCRACGHRLECPNCRAWLVEHRHTRRLQCHHCDHISAIPKACPACGAEDKLAACGPGVERLAEEVRDLFPEARLAVMASDTISGPREAAHLLRQVRDREIDILIGTQVVAKGHHFPLLTLVGVIDADLGLAGGDLRAAERTYQLLWQVAGRAGREAHPGRVYLQTYMPDHPVMQALASGDRTRFLQSEKDSRHVQGMPPFGRLAALIVSGEDEAAVRTAAQALGQSAPPRRTGAGTGPGAGALCPVAWSLPATASAHRAARCRRADSVAPVDSGHTATPPRARANRRRPLLIYVGHVGKTPDRYGRGKGARRLATPQPVC